MSRLYLYLLACCLVLSVLSACGDDADNRIPRFEKSKCEFPLHPTQKEDSTVTCGNLIVRENRTKENSPTIELHVARFHGKNRSASPLVYLIGGPGGSAKEMSAHISTVVVDAIAYPTDFILFDQRGVGKSKPSLYCYEIEQAFEDLTLDATPEEQKEVTVSSALECSERLVSTGVDLGAYNTVENAADVNDLRIALRYDTINLWGGSYGSRLALEIIRNHGNGLRSAVIEAIAPPQAAWSFEIGMNFEESLSSLFQACADNGPCNDNFGDLSTTLAETYIDLNTDPLTFPPSSDILTGYYLVSTIFSLMYDPDTYPYIPRLIQAAYERNSSEVVNILNMFNMVLQGGDMYFGMHASVVCQDHVRYMTAEDLESAYQNVRDEIKDVFFPYSETFLEFCKDWPMETAMPDIMDPVSSNVPTLVLNGEFDPITPARYGEMVSATLSRGQSFVFPNTGHGHSTDCARGMLLDFLAEPTDTVDASCIDDIEPVSFEGPATYRPTFFPRRDLLPPRLPPRIQIETK